MTLEVRACAIACALLTVVWPIAALAYRPFDGTDADVAAPDEVELEVGPIGYERQGAAHFVIAPALVLNYGVAPGLEAVLEGRGRWALRGSDDSALEDVAISLKDVLRRGSLQGRKGVSVAVETGVLLPGSERRLGAHVASIFSWRWPFVTLHLNLGNDLLTSVQYLASISLIMEGPGDWRVRPVGELLLERDFGQQQLERGAGSVLLGGITRWSDAWSFDLALRHGRVFGVNENEARAGFTWSFEVR